MILHFANCSENSYFWKSEKDKSFGEQAEPTNYLICFLKSLSRFLTKTAKIS